MNELTEGVEALAERKDLEEWAFYGSGLVAHGCLENIDEYMREAITKYGRLLLSKQRIKAEILEEELEYYRGVAEQLGAEKAVSQRDKVLEEFHQIEQILGKALGYPWYKDDLKNFPDATEADGVCIGAETAWSLAMIAADKIKQLEEKNTKLSKRHPTKEEALAQYHFIKANSRRSK